MQIIHVIGKVGAGKSWFIEKYCQNFPVFDIKSIYEEYNISPQDIRGEKYSQFANALEITLDNFCQQYHAEEYVVIESSGINRTINRFLLGRSHITILVESMFSLSVEFTRPYASKLNQIIEKAIENGEISVDYVFNGNSESFTPVIPPIWCENC